MFGLEEVLAGEIKALGGQAVKPLHRAVAFEGDWRLLYRANLELRTALRILIPLFHFPVHEQEDLYRSVRTFEWEKYLDLKQTFAIDATVHSPVFSHSKYAGLKVKDAIADRFRDRTGRRPSVHVESPDLRINLYLSKNRASISLDSSGRSLHLRGYRHAPVLAPLNEVLAAGLILLSGWDARSSFVDPMCGSGTLPIEAALLAMCRPPQQKPETLGFLRWNNFRENLWKEVLEQAQEQVQPLQADILGGDQSMKAYKAAQENAFVAGLDDKIRFERSRMEKLEPPAAPGTLIVNPPYDKRLPEEDIEELYTSIGDTLKQHYAGYRAWVFSCHLPALKHIGLRTMKKIPLYNGPLEGKLQGYELYEGSRKDKKND